MTGIGVGGALAYLLYPKKKNPRGEPARHEATHLAGGAENAPDVSPRSLVNHPPAEVALRVCVAAPGRRSGSTEAADIFLSKRRLKGIRRAAGLAYRITHRVSFRVCLCAAGLRILVRIAGKKTARGSGGLRRVSLSKREWCLAIGFTSLAFLIRLPVLRLQQGLTPDGVYYATLGRRLAAGDFRAGLSTFWSPLYPSLVGLASLIFRDVEAGGKFISAAAGSILVVPVYLLARTLYGPDVASVGAFLTAVHPTLLNYSTLLLTESTYTLLFAFALLSGLTALSGGGFMSFFSTGAALGACYLTRPEAVGYAGLMLALTLCAQIWGVDLPRAGVVARVLGLSLGFFLLSFPYLLFLRAASGGWTISDKLRAHAHSAASWESKWFGLSEGWQTTLADRLYAGLYREGDSSAGRGPLPVDRQSLLRTAGRSWEALRLELRPALGRVLGHDLLVLVGLGLFRTEWTKDIYLLLFLISTLIGYSLCPDDISDRLLVPIIPLLLCWAAKGVTEAERLLVRLSARLRISKALFYDSRALVRTMILTALFFNALHSLANTLSEVPPHHLLEYKAAGEWLRGRSATPPLIMAAHPYAAFYAGGRSLYLPAEEYAAVIGHARRREVDYLVIDEGAVSKGIWGNDEYANLRFLLDEQSRHPELELVYKFDRIPDRKLLIFTLT